MNLLSKLFDPLRHAAAAFFKHDLALRRDDAGLQIVLEPKVEGAFQRKPKPKKGSREEQAMCKEKQELALVLEQLTALLAELPETRHTLKPLVFVEQALLKKGLRALHKLPLDVLQRALEQLEGLVTNWSPMGLANLRSKMAVAILDREHMDPDADAEADAYRTAAVIDTPESEPTLPLVQGVSDDEALAAAYASLGAMAPSDAIEFHAELGSSSAKTLVAPRPRATAAGGEIPLREVQV